MTVYQEIFEVIKQRKADYEAGKAQENSYTAYLFDKGVDKICSMTWVNGITIPNIISRKRTP